MTRRFLAALLLALVAVVGYAGTALAAGPTCAQNPRACTLGNPAPAPTQQIEVDDDVPSLQRPSDATGTFDYACDPDHPAPKADPFAAKPTTTLFAQYCYAGYLSVMYDRHVGLGSTPGEAIDYAADRLGLSQENSAVNVSTMITAASDSLWAIALDAPWLGVVADAAQTVQDALGPLVWRYMTIALVCAAVGLVWLARRGDVGGSTSSAAMILLILLAATFALQWPSRVAETAQGALSGLSREVNTAVTRGAPNAAGDAGSAADSTLRAVHYQSWLVRQFGSADSATAVKYGPRLFRAGTMDLTDQKTCADGPGSKACQKVFDDHARDYKAVMAEVKKADPIAYANLQGKAGHGWRKALLELAGAVAVGLLRAALGLVIVASILTLVLLAMAAPVVALWAVLPGHHRAMWSVVVDGVVFAVGYGAVACVVAPVSALVVGALLTSGLPTWFSLLLVAIGTVAVLRKIRPLHAVSAMTSLQGRDVRAARRTAKRGGGIVRKGVKLGAAYVAGRSAVKSGVEAASEETPGPTPAPYVAPPLPPMLPPALTAAWQPLGLTAAPVPAQQANPVGWPMPTPRPEPGGETLLAEPTTRPDGSTVWDTYRPDMEGDSGEPEEYWEIHPSWRR